MINLNSYSGLRSSVFVRIIIEEYRTTSGGSYTQQVLAFSDHYQDFTIDNQVYSAVGALTGVSSTRSELRTSSNSVTVSLSGIPNSSIIEIINSKIKSSRVDIYRAYFDAQTNAQIGDVQGRFKGFVNNYSLEEDFDINARTSTNTILLECASNIDVLGNKRTGRKTNPESQKKHFPNDLSMDRVPNLENTTFDFGNPD